MKRTCHSQMYFCRCLARRDAFAAGFVLGSSRSELLVVLRCIQTSTRHPGNFLSLIPISRFLQTYDSEGEGGKIVVIKSKSETPAPAFCSGPGSGTSTRTGWSKTRTMRESSCGSRKSCKSCRRTVASCFSACSARLALAFKIYKQVLW